MCCCTFGDLGLMRMRVRRPVRELGELWVVESLG